MRLAGKVALVTGAGNDRNIGWGIARALADEGAKVVLCDLAPDVEALGARLRRPGERGFGAKVDVTDAAQVRALVARVVRDLGQLDIVASNAGVIRWERFLDVAPDSMRTQLEVNVLGHVHVCQAAAKAMIARGCGGRIVITSSVQSDAQFPINPVYGATKHAMHVFVGSLAVELAQYGITVNHIGPGWVRSPLNDVAPDQQTDEGIRAQAVAVPLHRDGTIDEMGRAVVYFASPDGAYTTGAFLRVDGGLGISKYD